MNALARALRVRVGAVPGGCYFNAVRALSHAPAGTVYVLGTAGGTAHAWLELTDGTIVEVTPGYDGVSADRYVAARRLTPTALAAALRTSPTWPPPDWRPDTPPLNAGDAADA